MRVSIITTCKNRLHHLKQTLPVNIKTASIYKNLEFILIDYTSVDGMDEWVKNEMMDHINSGILTYYRYNDGLIFSHSHSKNLAIRLSTGDIIINCDADNYLGEGFVEYIIKDLKDKSFIIGCDFDNFNYTTPLYNLDIFGRIAVKREYLLSICGYDESMVGWGYEDNDLYLRLISSGLSNIPLDIKYIDKDPILHSNKERSVNCGIHKIDSADINKGISEVNLSKGILVANNGSFGKGIVFKNFSNNEIIL
jgi:predicted glycosyltransferase involved in capsule biosynthesis